jgi:hypothetical protein
MNWTDPQYRLKSYYSQTAALAERIAAIQAWQQDDSLSEYHAEFARTEQVERRRQTKLYRKASMLESLIERGVC